MHYLANHSCILSLKCIKKGDINEPAALQQYITVDNIPLSELEIIATCFFSDTENILGALLVEVDISVNTQRNISLHFRKRSKHFFSYRNNEHRHEQKKLNKLQKYILRCRDSSREPFT